MDVDAVGQVRTAELRPEVVRLDVILDEEGHHITWRFSHTRFEFSEPFARVNPSVGTRTDGTVVAAVAEANLVHQRIIPVEVMRIEHEGTHAGVPLRVKPRAMVAGRVEDAVCVGGEGVVRFREGDLVVGTVAQNLHPVAFTLGGLRLDRRLIRGKDAP